MSLGPDITQVPLYIDSSDLKVIEDSRLYKEIFLAEEKSL